MGTPSTRWKFTGTLIFRPLRRPLNSSNMTPFMRLPNGDDNSGFITTFMAFRSAAGGGDDIQTLPFASAMAAPAPPNQMVSMKVRRRGPQHQQHQAHQRGGRNDDGGV